MMEDEGEIEYLDEDEDVVQQYVQKVPTFQPVIQSVQTLASEDIEDQIEPLLVERKVQHKRRARSEDDSDYDPNDDLQELIAQRKKRKQNVQKPKRVLTRPEPTYTLKPKPEPRSVQNIQSLNKKYESKLKSLPNLTVRKKLVTNKPEMVRTVKKVVKKDDLNERRKSGIRIPDYEDPICLPVRAVKRDEYDVKKLKLWNNLCFEQYRKADTVFKPHRGDTVKSTRTILLRNMKNKYTGKIDTSIQGKTSVENSRGEKKTESFQGTLPRYREKTAMVNSYPLVLGPQRYFKHTYEAILTKEDQKDGDVLVVYKPREAVSAVYELIGKKNDEQDRTELDESRDEKRALKELTCCKICAPCYQVSWRGVRKHQNKQENLECAICKRSYVSVYNLLSHLNTNHSAKDVGRHRARLSNTLASVVEYHYQCRICQERFNSIKLLRKHVTKHQGVEVFKCEVGNHMAS